MKGIKLATSEDKKHHTVVGDNSYGEEHERTHDPTCFLKGVREAKDAGTNNSYKYVGKGLELGGEWAGIP